MSDKTDQKSIEKIGGRIISLLRRKYPKLQSKKLPISKENKIHIRFYFKVGNPSKNALYPNLMKFLSQNLSSIDGDKINYQLDRLGNSILVNPIGGGQIELLLVHPANF
ncbi:MAG: hypothetical protein INQ03_22930 [Candidatus Heimdallarchaeota archaeon]|nr:hypothetical protein [Candidatus Heimdallarchaeota archaeon]